MDQAEKNGKLALKDKQSVAVKTAKFLQKLGVGSNYYFFESYVDQNGRRVFKDRFGNTQAAPNGLYYSDGDIYIDINAGTDSHSITLRTLSHELTHMIQQWSAAKYKGIADFLAEQYDKEGRSAYEAAKAKQAELSELRGKRVSFQEAYHEFVADSMSTMFDDGNLYDILTDLKKKDKTIFDYIKKFFDGLAAKVRNRYANTQAETDEGQFVQGLSKETIYRLQQMFADALVETSENYAASEQKNTDSEIGVQYSQKGAKQYDYSKSFAEQLQDYQSGLIPKGDTLIIGATPEVFCKIGMAALPVTLNTTHVDYALHGAKDFDHHLGQALLEQLPEAIKKPVAIMTSGTKKNSSIVAMLEVRHNGKQVVVPVVVDGFGRQNGIQIDSNAVTSIYGKNYSISRVLYDAITQEANGQFRLYYLNKNKATELLQKARVPMPKSSAAYVDGFIHSLADPRSPVKSRISDVIQSQQFKRWFGDWQNNPKSASKIVNADGTPKIMYHGSAEQFTAFSYGSIGSSTGVGILGDGFYFTDKEKLAKDYGANVYPVYLQMKKPYMATEGDAYKLKVADLQAKGYDGVILHAPSGNVYMVFENTQIKSATDNIGTFDGNNPDIRYQDRAAAPSNRALLAQALEGVAANVEDYQTVQEYRQIVPLLDAEEAKLSRLNAQIREMTFGKGSRDREKLVALRLEAKQTQNRIDIYDRQLLKLEAGHRNRKQVGRKKPRHFVEALVLALSIFPGSHPPSIVDANELNFCVRDGERWERCRRQMKRPERVAAVGKMQACFVRRSNCRAPQQETGGQKKASTFLSRLSCVCVTYFHGQSPGNYRRRTCA